MRKILLSFLCLFALHSAHATDDIGGFWKTISDEGIAQCIIAVYEYQGLYYGRIIATFDDYGKKIDDSIYKPVKRAPGVVGDPYYSGLDIIWDLEDSGNKFKGRILDPEKGNTYRAELWIEGENLVVRGRLLMFGRSQEWLPVGPKDWPKDFKIPDVKTFVPSIPETK